MRTLFLLLVTLLLVAGSALRVHVSVAHPDFQALLQSHHQLATPLTSYDTLREAIFLAQHNQSVYHGSTVHHSPLLVHTLAHWSHSDLPFLVADLITALTLATFCYNHTAQPSHFIYALCLYFLHPFALATSVARSAAVFNNLLLALTLLAAQLRMHMATAVLLALATHLSVHNLLLLPALLLLANPHTHGPSRPRLPLILQTLATLLMWLVFARLATSFTSSWDWLPSHLRFQLLIDDMQPNMGLWWYFFLEIFAHFRPFYHFIAQYAVAFFAFPLAVRLHRLPTHLVHIQLVVLAAFKPYPVLDDFVFHMALLPMLWSRVSPHLRSSYVWLTMILLACVLEPLFWHEYIYRASGNANFVYATHMLYIMAHVLMLVDLTRAAVFLSDPDAYTEQKRVNDARAAIAANTAANKTKTE